MGQFTIDVVRGGVEPELSEDVKLAFFRIGQEALNNARKHAGASKVTIELEFKKSRIKMAVTDNGSGFDVKKTLGNIENRGSLGLMSMQERANLIGAILRIESKPGHGTKVKVEIRL